METIKAQNIVLGSGAAGLNAASRLKEYGVDDVLLITEGLKAGTSRNTGSDKQTYYKLSLSGSDGDSVRSLAEDLYKGRAVDGDIALCEAALSTKCFLRLSEMGVPFPKSRYGEYPGYKTDHDSRKRASSAGPYTSKFMTEALERDVKGKGIKILDGHQAIRLLEDDGEIRGLVLLERKTGKMLTALCHSLVFATGGPAGIYKMSVYPESQFGSTGLAFEIGARGKNLTEWQYGLASVSPRWNVSGSYMQVIPRFVSIDSDGAEHEFLSGDMLSLVFLKGYQWPFDVRKLEKGSSIVDALCYLELEKGRKVFLDYIHNPGMARTLDFSKLSPEAREYLERAGATGDDPVQRLKEMNEPAYRFYKERGVDLEKEYLEISLSAQHNNGGLAMNLWWESNIKGFFPVGEVAASHGVYRPGGSALNAGQVGSERASTYISKLRQSKEWDGILSERNKEAVEAMEDIASHANEGTRELSKEYSRLREMMSIKASVIRNKESLEEALKEVGGMLSAFNDVRIAKDGDLWMLFEYRNALLTSRMYLFAMLEYAKRGGMSRGSALYTKKDGDIRPNGLDGRFTYSLENEGKEPDILEVFMEGGVMRSEVRKPRPIPSDDDFFERVWATYRENGSVY